jgi:hypothetical protein
MDKETFEGSWDIIGNLEDRLSGFFFDNGDYCEADLIDWIDDAIKELESFKQEIKYPTRK